MLNEITKEQAEKVFEDYSDYVYQTAFLLTKSKTLADDITQETFLQVFKKFHTYNSTKPIKPWIYKITLNITRNILRRQKWLNFVGIVPEPEGDCADNLIEKAILQNEADQELWIEINRLSLKSKEVVVLHFYLGLKLQETADVLNIPLGTCKSRLNSALTALRRQMSQKQINNYFEGGANYEK